MKYTDRKKTPLKWHRTVSFVIQPLLILGFAWLLFCMINELFSLHLDFAWPLLTPLIQSVNPSLSMHNLGSMFWPVTIIFFVTVVLLVLSIRVWIGLLRWQNYARVLWLVFLLAETAGLTAGIIALSTKSDVLHALRMFAAFDSMSRSLLHVIYALAIMICLWNLIFLILNLIYYRKRKLLFRPDYIQPERTVDSAVSVTGSTSVKTEPDAAADNRPFPEENNSADNSELVKSEQSDADTETESGKPEHEVRKQETSENSGIETLSMKKSETNEAEKTADGKKEVSSEAETSPYASLENADVKKENEKEACRDDNHLFCPYCGAKLGRYDVSYCSHCGRKLV